MSDIALPQGEGQEATQGLSVLLTGGSGQLGSAIIMAAASRGLRMFAPTRPQLDITRPTDELYALVSSLPGARPGVVVHCAALVDWRLCHDFPNKALTVNALGALNVARLCDRLGVLMVHVSTDAVFPGRHRKSGYTELDTPTRPVSLYGASKLAGEHLVGQTCRHLIVRVGWLFSSIPATDKKFVGLILRQASQGGIVSVVTDKVGSPAFAPHVAAKILDLSIAGTEGVRHLANAGTATRYDLACRIVDRFGYGAAVLPATSDAFPDPVRRPEYSVLETVYADAALPPWQHAVDELAAANHKLRIR